jgi:hypothetical protein
LKTNYEIKTLNIIKNIGSLNLIDKGVKVMDDEHWINNLNNDIKLLASQVEK